MQPQRKVIDASRGKWVEMGSTTTQQPVSVGSAKQPYFVPVSHKPQGPITRTSMPRYIPPQHKPTINVIGGNQQEYIPVQQQPKYISQGIYHPEKPVSQPVMEAPKQEAPTASEKGKEPKTQGISLDPEYRHFNMNGCKTIEDAYNQNSHLMKIIPE